MLSGMLQQTVNDGRKQGGSHRPAYGTVPRSELSLEREREDRKELERRGAKKEGTSHGNKRLNLKKKKRLSKEQEGWRGNRETEGEDGRRDKEGGNPQAATD